MTDQTHFRPLYGIVLLISVFLQSVLWADPSDTFISAKAAYREKMESAQLNAEKQRQSVLNQAAVRLDRIEQHFTQQGNHQFSFEASRMADEIRDGKIDAIEASKFTSKDLQGFLGKIREALDAVAQNSAKQIAEVNQAYVDELKALVAEYEAAGEAGLVVEVQRELRAHTPSDP